MGDRWPFTVDGVTLYCVHGWVIFQADGKYYWVNGGANIARTWFGVDCKDAAAIWRIDPKNVDLKVNIGPIIDRGRSICEQREKESDSTR